MTFLIKGKKKRQHRVAFKRRRMVGTDVSSSASTSSTLDRLLYGDQTTQRGFIIEEPELNPERRDEAAEYTSQSSYPVTMTAATASAANVPDLFTTLPPDPRPA
ncbi:hypothetical protein G7Y89_g4286 [Cudoniella acicularis]|uniref:Uncharacterized protein n=1 Tax=Cudoniella acicularis TaxID=354080 RepID=A0A8H4RPS5_9HELO|nr:hypothetical protein G7Y89_g4286 [Cudoniella acicularis]